MSLIDSLACVTTSGHQLILIDKIITAIGRSGRQTQSSAYIRFVLGCENQNISLNNNYIIFKPENARPIGLYGQYSILPFRWVKSIIRLKVDFKVKQALLNISPTQLNSLTALTAGGFYNKMPFSFALTAWLKSINTLSAIQWHDRCWFMDATYTSNGCNVFR